MPSEVRIGTAGWAIPARDSNAFPTEGSALERYSARFDCTEINSSFHRSHRTATWARWAASVPDGFRFSCKLPKTITHERRLADCAGPLADALEEMGGLGARLAVLLVQLPPSLAFEGDTAAAFFTALRRLWQGDVACEPRHRSWLAAEAVALMAGEGIARVAADPAKEPGFALAGGAGDLVYYRWHGSPAVYRSSYDDGRLESLAERLRAVPAKRRWCIFDNTASGAATGDALKLVRLMGGETG
jgi:uncharacterized protein YecE (DUF72 family)